MFNRTKLLQMEETVEVKDIKNAVRDIYCIQGGGISFSYPNTFNFINAIDTEIICKDNEYRFIGGEIGFRYTQLIYSIVAFNFLKKLFKVVEMVLILKLRTGL
jgi:hypothetical protein